ncbi:MAG: SDR family NAD(P)-dependent oxidoreductase [Verrucomicrobiae bacterium]|nr:SDR family NAD(P)-dependent oxidoreductase [Verrucomicrobiae bacterium]
MSSFNGNSSLPFRDKAVLVTGSTRHLGLDIARAFLREGAAVSINSGNPENVAKTVAQLREEGFNAVYPAVADLADEQQVKTMVESFAGVCHGLDVLVNNACHLGVEGNFLSSSPSFWDQVLAVNARGCFLCSLFAARRMKESGGGAIVNVSSNTAARPLRNRTAYCASKGAVESLTRAMALDLAPYHIRVNAVVPGYIRTSRWENLSAGDIVRRRANVPLGSESGGEDIAQAVLFLAGDRARCITGAQLVVDGGASSQLLPPDCEV